MSAPGPGGRVPDLFVERTFSGEASPAERARVLADPDAKERLDDLMHQNVGFHVRVDEAAQLRAIDARAREAAAAEALAGKRATTGWWPVLLVGAPLALLALVLVRTPPETLSPSGRPPTEQTTAKGLKAKLQLTQHTPRGVERVSTDEVLFAGDEIQVFTVSGDATHGVVLSIDGNGAVTRHFPEGDDTALPKGKHPLGRAFQLDDAPRFERFVFVTDDAPLDVQGVLEAARATGRSKDPRKALLELPAGVEQTSFVVRKGAK